MSSNLAVAIQADNFLLSGSVRISTLARTNSIGWLIRGEVIRKKYESLFLPDIKA